jgi:hypothetical protein
VRFWLKSTAVDTTVITPEIQATVRDPPVREFMNSLIITYGEEYQQKPLLTRIKYQALVPDIPPVFCIEEFGNIIAKFEVSFVVSLG